MDWNEWEPWYERIVSDLGLDRSRDIESARLLGQLLERHDGDIQAFDELLRGKSVIIIGPAPFHETDFGDAVIVSAGSATEQLILGGIMPDVIVTDLDGNVRAQVKARSSGALAVIHAHGDNMPALREWVPRFRSPVMGTTQVKPFGKLQNFGGFTDGDRAVFLAMHFGARHISLVGFDFDNPVVKPGGDISLKRKKLAYARELIKYAMAKHGCIEIGNEPGKV